MRKPSEGQLKRAPQPKPLGRSTRDAILDKALELFATNGYAGTSVRALTRAVGLTEGSLYNHFEGKEAILTALVNVSSPAQSTARLQHERYRRLAADPDAFCRLHAAAKLAEWTDPREQRLVHLLTLERQRLKREREIFSKAWFGDEVGLMEQYFQGFAEQGLIRAPDPRETARIFMAGLTFIRIEYLIIPDKPATPAKIRLQISRYLENFLALVLTQPAGNSP